MKRGRTGRKRSVLVRMVVKNPRVNQLANVPKAQVILCPANISVSSLCHTEEVKNVLLL